MDTAAGERKAVYLALKSLKVADRDAAFAAFGVGGLGEKRRKRRTADAVFATPAATADSAHLVALVDPEVPREVARIRRDRVLESAASVAVAAFKALVCASRVN